MDIRSLPAVSAGPQGLDALGATAAPASTQVQPVSNTLDPPVKIDIGTGAPEARFVRDSDTRTLVFQVVDPASGDVLAQLPSESALRNRAYASTTAAHAAQSGSVSRVA